MRSHRKTWTNLAWIAAMALILAAFAAPASAQRPEDNGIAAAPSGPSAPAGPVPVGGPWLEFAFDGVGVPAYACTSCTPSSGGNSVYADTPPWTFDAPLGGADLTIVDAFLLGDQFEVFDFGFSLGTTSASVAAGDCGSDPVPCLADPNASKAVFQLAEGPHSITIVPTASPFGGGAAYFRVDAAGRYIQAIPALGPAGLALLVGVLALAAVVYLRRKRIA